MRPDFEGDSELAVLSYRNVPSLTDGPDLINLRWTLDERSVLSRDVLATIRHELRAEQADLAALQRYAVDDPYGEHALSAAVFGYFGLAPDSASVTCGAGVASLLHGLAGLAQTAEVAVIGPVYPDFPHWVRQRGGWCVSDASAGAPALFYLERPALIGDVFRDLDDVEALCRRAAACDALVVVDESNANYCPPAYSAATLVARHAHLLVLRGMSKAYGLGGLRLAYCLCAPSLVDRVRSVLAPLAVSTLSLRLAGAVLHLGDIAQPLRRLVRLRKQECAFLIRAADVGEPFPSSEHLPYLLLDDDFAAARLESRGVVGKTHPLWTGHPSPPLLRLSVPLEERRMSRFRALLDR
ncbi:aminotransferase class I/II-fold pyridoxal phosphate-dependent enzyme [Streptomyces sp. NPDC060028]|uniref:aminotransferase class I/II-fold pyridoxal phosphate-dependent enzyme n=1 Tax=Streptomyces sp. NPDC060028 TaxID=3347041 RepID=UPI0036CB69D9